jgi:hypothetical protein
VADDDALPGGVHPDRGVATASLTVAIRDP